MATKASKSLSTGESLTVFWPMSTCWRIGSNRSRSRRRFPLRAYGGVWAGQLRWGKLTHARVLGVLRKPCYAGTYVYGRYATRRTVEPDGTVRTGVRLLPRDQWPVVLHDHHEGYITWQNFLGIEAKLKANCTHDGARPAREGLALCQGIIGCGSGGRPLTTPYHRRRG